MTWQEEAPKGKGKGGRAKKADESDDDFKMDEDDDESGSDEPSDDGSDFVPSEDEKPKKRGGGGGGRGGRGRGGGGGRSVVRGAGRRGRGKKGRCFLCTQQFCLSQAFFFRSARQILKEKC